MYHIGICDDGENTCSSLEEMVLLYAEKNNIIMETKVWYAGEELCNYLEQGGCLDILFLDIELPEWTGIEVGDFIRNRLEDRGMQIIYIYGKTSYAQELFKTQPMDFLVKPISRQQIEDTLDLAVKLLERSAERFEFQSGRDYYYIPYGEIIYFESEGRKIRIVAAGAEKEFYGGIRELEKKLPKEFFPIHAFQGNCPGNDYLNLKSIPLCFKIAFAVWRDLIFVSTVTCRFVMGLNQMSWSPFP